MKKVILLILDGWGLGPKDKFNAIDNAKTPNFDRLIREYPNNRLRSDGPYVGLPDGQFGTSEINHQVIGAGRIIPQDLPRINNEIESGHFFTNEVLVEACRRCVENNSALHLAGVLSDGKVHSAMNHIRSLIKLAKQERVPRVFIHAFTDGRDTPPKSTEKYLSEIERELSQLPYGRISTLQGRFYLDRDRDWKKTNKAVDLMVEGKGVKMNDWQAAVNFEYNQNNTDEFMDQYLIDKDGIIKPNDSLIFFHYRTDRMYQIVKGVLDKEIKNLSVTTFIEISEDFKTNIAFPRMLITNTLAQTIADAGKTQFHLTETEKYTHLTFFFNGGREKEFNKEEWKRLQSNRQVKPFYNFEPSMKNFDITDEILEKIKENKTDFMVVNFASPDMVGHTGNYEAAVISAESVDFCLGKIYETLKDKLDEYALIITADHGNSDEMWDYESNQPHTQHTTNPVPLILVSNLKKKLKRRESLEDIAPTILDLMEIEKPEVMTGTSLIIR